MKCSVEMYIPAAGDFITSSPSHQLKRKALVAPKDRMVKIKICSMVKVFSALPAKE